MKCRSCNSKNIQLLKEGNYHTGYFCNDCGFGSIDYYSGGCCANQSLIEIRFEQSNGVIVQREACKNCKKLVSGAKKKSKDFDSLILYTQSAFVAFNEKLRESHNKLSLYIRNLSEKFREEKSNEWWKKYSGYLNTPEWKAKRLQVLERENGICQGCKNSKAVHVHHTTYDNIGDELLFQLVALCADCHQKLHPDKFL